MSNKPTNAVDTVVTFQKVLLSPLFMQRSIGHSPSVSFVSVLTNRLVLNLKQVGNRHTHSEAATLSDLAFATNSFVGNLGAPLRVSNEDGQGEEIPKPENKDHEVQEYELQEQGMQEEHRDDQDVLIVEDL